MRTVSSRLLEHSQNSPEQICLRLLRAGQPDQAVNYGHLVSRANEYARALAEQGILPGEVVILILQHGEDLVNAFFGTILRGAIPSIMPFLTEKLDPEKYRLSLVALLQVTRPTAVVTYPEFENEVTRAAQEARLGCRVLVSSSIPQRGMQPPDDLPGLRCNPNQIVLLQHSSGTTGLQKGVALSHQAVFNQLDAYSRSLHITSDDVVVSWLPLYHDMGLIAGFLMPLLLGIPLVLLSPFDWVRAPGRLFQAVSEYGGTLTWLPNFAYNFCSRKVRERDLQGVDLSSWRAVINCSEPMHWRSHQMFAERFASYGLQQAALATCYAMAENVFAVTQGGIDSPVCVDTIEQAALFNQQRAQPSAPTDNGVRMLSAGKPLSNVRIRILDSRGEELPERHIGEIALQSNCMLTGYFNRPDLSEKAFRDGWYLTGDLGYIAAGELYITGRKKDLIIVGGKNIYPQDLERLADETPGVHPGRSVAFGVYNEDSGTEDVVIIAETDVTKDTAKQAIADDIRQRVTRGSDIALRSVLVVEREWLLKTSSGKIARAANREKYLAM